MKDSTHIKAAKKDVEQRLLQNNDDLSGSVNCLNEMKKIASLIEAVSIPFLYFEPRTNSRSSVYSLLLLVY
jgi:hypothetical protein